MGHLSQITFLNLVEIHLKHF